MNSKQLVSELVVPAVQIWAAVYCVTRYGLSTATPVGPSMMPTFPPKGGQLLVEHFTPQWGAIQPGDVVTCESPENPRELVCKRVVATEGDEVFVYRGPFTQCIKVPQGHCWLQGDNAAVSKDSRAYGPVPLALVKGRVIAQLWPWSHARWIERHVPAIMGGIYVKSASPA